MAADPSRHAVFDRVDDAVIADPDAKTGPTSEGACTWRARILGEQSDCTLDPTANLRAELAQGADCRRTKLDAIRAHSQTGVVEGRAAAFILVDGVDILDLQQPTHRTDGSEYPYGPATFLPANPVGLLPPDSAALLPTTTPKHAMIGICTCGEPGCSSLWLQVRRHGDEVVWEPDPDTPQPHH